jgi:hypothetical protein
MGSLHEMLVLSHSAGTPLAVRPALPVRQPRQGCNREEDQRETKTVNPRASHYPCNGFLGQVMGTALILDPHSCGHASLSHGLEVADFLQPFSRVGNDVIE